MSLDAPTRHRDEDFTMARFSTARRSRIRMIPDALSLEVRICPSAITPSSRPDHRADVSRVTHDGSQQTLLVEQLRHQLTSTAIPLAKKPPKAPKAPKAKATVSVTPKSLAAAVKSAKPGETIVLAPGVYTQNVVFNKQSNITIVGAPNQSSILAPRRGDAIKVMLSSNITIENVWLRSQGSQGRGISVVGSSVNVQNIKTDGTLGDGVVVTSYQGHNASLTATASQFDSVQTGDGLDLRLGSSSTINGCTFNNDGTAPGVGLSSVGLVLSGNATATILNSQFIGNTNAGLVALQNSVVTAQQSTFSNNHRGDGALFLNQATVNLVGNTFASNGEIRGEATGLNGVEFSTGFTGTAVVTGNSFVDNTAAGIWSGGSSNNIQITNNTFDNNVTGVFLDASAAPISATVQGNTFVVPVRSPDLYVGFLTIGRVTATVGGDGTLANTIENYANGRYIAESNGGPNAFVGNPNVTILTNTFLSNGMPVAPSQAIMTPG
jgi:parallel beta-helix repeat protein